MSERFLKTGQMGLPPIECDYSHPCLGGGTGLPPIWWPYSNPQPPIPPMGYNNPPEPSGNPIPVEPVGHTPQNSAVPPKDPADANTLPTANQPASSIWDEPVSTETAILIGGGILAVIVGITILKG